MGYMHTKQKGFVSIFAVLIIMTVLTLVAVGFSTLTRNAERRTLDSQLNTQAFYAAESGVNDAVRLIRASNPITEANKPTCKGPADNGSNLTYNYDTKLDVGYSCVLIDPRPPEIVIDDVPVQGVGEPVVMPLNMINAAGNPAPLDVPLDFYWDSPIRTDTAPSCDGTNFGISTGGENSGSPILPGSATWTGNRIGILRVDITPTNDLSRGALADKGYTFILYPCNSATGTTTLGAVNTVLHKAGTGPAACTNVSNAYRCHIQLTFSVFGTGAAPTSPTYSIRMQSFYNPVKVMLTAAGRRFTGAVAVVDSTGRARDVFRRVKEYVELNPIPGKSPSEALVSGDSICKRLISGQTATSFEVGDLPAGADSKPCDPDDATP
jgi:hypothetical protein